MGGLFKNEVVRTPVDCGGRIKNAAANNWRGIVSTILAIILLVYYFELKQKSKSLLKGIWTILFIIYLLKPLPTSACALLPIFSLPMLGVTASIFCCKSLIDLNIMLFFLAQWLLLLLNNTGMDKRIICYFMSSGDASAYTPKQLVIKTCLAGFCSAAISERELASQALMGYITSALEPHKLNKVECDYGKLKAVLCVAAAVSSSIGSLCFLHASLTTLQLRAMLHTPVNTFTEYPDTLNFLDYSVYAIPVALVMLIANMGYMAFLVSRLTKGSTNILTRKAIQASFMKNKHAIGDMTNHERLSVVFLILYLLSFLGRWTQRFEAGWASFRAATPLLHNPPTIVRMCLVGDATPAAAFVVILHFLPKSLHFLKIWSVSKEIDMPPMKAESGILYWKFVDKATDYPIFFVVGSGCIIYKCVYHTGLNLDYIEDLKSIYEGLPWNGWILIVVLVAVFFGNIMDGVAAQACLMPFMLAGTAMSGEWANKLHLVALGVGLGTGFGFCGPHMHSTSVYVRKVGKVGLADQIKYSIGSVVICGLLLWLSLCFYAPLYFNDCYPQLSASAILTTTTTESAAGGDPAPP